jgi:N-acetylneuraminic acid mutarotase
MPIVRQGAAAVVDKNIVYVIGGQNNSGYLTTVESYNTTTNTWKTEASLLVGKAFPATGLLGTTPVAADGYNGTLLGDNEGYNTSLNTWTTLTADPTPRTQGCFSAITGQLYVAGGNLTGGQPISLNEAYSPTKKSWTTLAPMPIGVAFPGSAQAGGLLYCFGGGEYPNTAYNYVQIYQP